MFFTLLTKKLLGIQVSPILNGLKYQCYSITIVNLPSQKTHQFSKIKALFGVPN